MMSDLERLAHYRAAARRIIAKQERVRAESLRKYEAMQALQQQAALIACGFITGISVLMLAATAGVI